MDRPGLVDLNRTAAQITDLKARLRVLQGQTIFYGWTDQITSLQAEIDQLNAKAAAAIRQPSLATA